MRKWIFLSVITVAIPLMSVAQDDMYFVPKKSDKTKGSKYTTPQEYTYYSGSDRNVDEYNRHVSYVTEIDSAGNDIIDFDGISGVYQDSLSQYSEEDYEYTRRMTRFDDYAWTDPYWAGYYAGRSMRWGWYDPWFYSGWYYDPWYYSWYTPWYHGYYGWHLHGWGYPHYTVSYNPRPTNTFRHISGTGRRPLAGYNGANTISGGISNRDRTKSGTIRNRTFNASNHFGTNRNTTTTTNNRNNSFNNNTTSRSTNSFSNNRSNFGGSRSTGGGFSGGSRSTGGSGGSRFGGRR